MALLWREHPWLTGIGTIIAVLLAVGAAPFASGSLLFEWPGSPAEYGVAANPAELLCLSALAAGAPLVGIIGGALGAAVALRAGWSLIAAIPLGMISLALIIVNFLQIVLMTQMFL